MAETSTLTQDQRVTWTKDDLIRTIKADARQLQRKLEEVKRDAEQALLMMQDGNMVYGAGTASGPFGTTAQAEIALLLSRLQTSSACALMLGVSEEDVKAAYSRNLND
jgi:hypothetical protein